jgi:hypothetical protein
MSSRPKVAVSYSWKEERTGPNIGAVDGFCALLNAQGVVVVRDVDRLKHGECLSTFMRDIGASDYLCVFLSDGYLKSPNCMYELLVAWQRSKDNPHEFRQRVKVWVMPSAEDIRKPESRLEYLDHWMTEKKRIEPLIKKHAVSGLAAAELEGFRRIKQFAEHVNEMLCFFADTLSPQSVGEFHGWIGREFASSSLVSDEAALARVYENTVAEMEGVLNRQPTLQKFLSSATTGLVQNEGGTWRLAPAVQNRNFKVCLHLEGIVRCLPSFRGLAGDWRALGDLAGGLVVLAIDREWVLRMREDARLKSVDFPADRESIAIGGGRQANLLHLVSSALADGRARLEKVFGKPPLDEFLMPDAACLMRGIGQEDHLKEVKLHFVRFVLGPNTPIDEANGRQVDILFKRTKEVIFAAFHDDHTPFAATGENYKRLTETIRQQLKVEDLLLIHPSGEDPAALLADYVRVLRFLGKIFDSVQSNSQA